jgi:hypothetical protein
MIATARSFLLLLLLLLPALVFAQAPASDHVLDQDREIARYLSAVRFPAAFKRGINLVIEEEGRSNAQLDRVLALSDEAIITAIVPVYRELLTAREAKEMADFWSSETGMHITRQQIENIGNPDPAIHWTLEQRSLYEGFLLTEGGAANGRVVAIQNSEAHFLRINAAIDAAAGN